MLFDQAIALRPITPVDQPFLYTLYASTRTDELALLPWSEAQKSAFLQMQFAAQTAFYQQSFAQATFSIVCLADEPIGRFYVARQVEDIHLIDITLLPAYRNQGIGAHLLCNLLAEGTLRQTPVRLQVAVGNPAQRLYSRLGFAPHETTGVYLTMVWRPGIQAISALDSDP